MATNICAHIFRGAVNIAAAPLWCHTGCEKKRFRKDVKVFENSCLSSIKLYSISYFIIHFGNLKLNILDFEILNRSPAKETQ